MSSTDHFVLFAIINKFIEFEQIPTAPLEK